MGASSTAPPMESGSVCDLSRTQLILALSGMVLTLLTSTMDQAIAIAAMPRAIASLNGFARYSWPTTSLLLTSTIAMPVFAKLSDLYGRKWFYLSSTAILVASLVLCGAAGNLPMPLDGMNQLIVARGFLGIGNGAIIALTFTLVADLFPPSELPPNRMWAIFQPKGDREGHDRSHALPQSQAGGNMQVHDK